MRWLIRLEQGSHPRFGQTRGEVLVWAVRPYLTLRSGERSFLQPAAVFPGLRAAHAYARGECARYDRHRKAGI